MTEFEKESSTNRPPFFIVGFSRSGTTLLSVLLNKHSQICVTPETGFCRGVFPCGQIDHRRRDHDYLIDRVFGYWRIPDLDVSRSDFEVIFRRGTADYRSAFICLLECYRKLSGKTLIGEKSPLHLLYVPLLLDWFPESRIYCLVRDGRDVVSSMMKAPFTHNHLSRHAAEWAEMSRIARSSQARFPNNFTVVRFEDLIQHPKNTLTPICRELGQEFEIEQLDPVLDSAVIPNWEKQWKNKAISGIDASKLALWNTRYAPRKLAYLGEIMTDELKHWGYETSSASGLSHSTKAMLKLSSMPFRGNVYKFFRTLSVHIRVLLCRMKFKDMY